MTQRVKNVKIVVPPVLSNFDTEKRNTRATTKGERRNSELRPISQSGDQGQDGDRIQVSSDEERGNAVEYNTKGFSNLNVKHQKTSVYLRNYHYFNISTDIPVQLHSVNFEDNMTSVLVNFQADDGIDVVDYLQVPITHLYTTDTSHQNLYDTQTVGPHGKNDTLQYTYQEESTLYDDLAQNTNNKPQILKQESSYMQNKLYNRVGKRILEEFGEKYYQDYKQEYIRQLHVLQAKWNRQAQEQDGDVEGSEKSSRLARLLIPYLCVRDYSIQSPTAAYRPRQNSAVEQLRQKLQSKINFDTGYNSANLQLQNTTIDTTTRFIAHFIKRNAQEMDSVLNQYINYLKSSTKQLFLLKQQFSKLNVQDVLQNPAYRVQSQDKRNHASQQIGQIIQQLYLPDEGQITKQGEEIQNMMNRIKQLQQSQQFQAYLLLFWRTIVPFTFYIVSGNVYLAFYQKQINLILKWLQSGGQPIEVPQYRITQVYMQLLRCFEYNVYQLIINFLQFIEKEIIFTDKKFLIDTLGQQTAKQEEMGKFLTELLVKMNFKLNKGEYFDKSFYKEEVQLQFKKLPGYAVDESLDEQLLRISVNNKVVLPSNIEDYQLVISPSITELCQDLQNKLKILYITFICVPICLSKNYFYISADLDNGWKDLLFYYDNKNVTRQSSYMQHFETDNQVSVLDLQYQVLLQNQESKIHMFKDTVIGNFGLLPSIFVIDDQNSTVNAIEERFKHISGTVELVCDVVKERILQQNGLKIIQDFVETSSYMLVMRNQWAAQELQYDELESMLTHTDEVQQFIRAYNFQIGQISVIPDFLYQYMIQLDMREFKAQYKDYLLFWLRQTSVLALQNIQKYFRSIVLRAEKFLEVFSLPVSPNTIETNRKVIDNLNREDKPKIFQTIYNTVDYAITTYLFNFNEYQPLEDDDIENSAAAMLSFVRQVKLTQRQNQIVTEYETLFKELIVNMQQFMKIQSTYFLDYYKDLLQVKLDDIKESSNYAAHFRQVFTIIGQDYKLTAFDIQQQQRSELCQKFKDQEQGFYSSFARNTALKVYSKRFSNEELVSYSQPGSPTMTQDEEEYLTELSLYQRPNTQSNEGFDITRIVMELMFLTVEFAKLQRFLTIWESKMQVSCDPKVLNFSECVLRVQDLYKTICYSHFVDKLYNSADMTLDKINNSHLIQIVDDIAHSINNLKDNYKTSLSITNLGQQVEMQYTYINWKEYVEIIQQTFLQQLGFIMFINFITNKSFSHIHIQHIKQYMMVDIRQPERVTIKDLQEAYQKNDHALDYLKILCDDAEKNKQAEEVLDNVQELYGNIVVEQLIQTDYLVYPIIAMKERPDQTDSYHYKEIYDFVEIGHVQTVQILNNISFLSGSGSFEDQVNKYITELEQMKETMDKYRFNKFIEQKARNVESVSLYLKFLITLLRYVPVIIEHMKYIQDKCHIIANEYKKKDQFQLQHPYLDFKISFLNQSESNVVTQQQLIWNEIITKQFQVNQKIVTVISNQTLLRQLQNIYTQIHAIFVRVRRDENAHIFTQFRAPKLFQVQASQNISTSDNKIVPLVDGNLYPHYLLFPRIYQFTFGSFPYEFSFFNTLTTVRQALLPNVTDLVTTHSPLRGRLILGLRSHDEYLEFKNPVVAPPANYMVPDTILQCVRETMLFKLKNCVTQFMSIMDDIVNKDVFSEDTIDPILLSRLEDFISKQLSFVTFVLIQTYIKQQMTINTQNIKVIDKSQVEGTTIFYDVQSTIKVCRRAILRMKEKGSMNMGVLETLEIMINDYNSLFDRLEKEVHFKLDNYFKNQTVGHQAKNQQKGEQKDEGCEEEEEEEVDFKNNVQEISIVSLLGNANVQFPLIEYDIMQEDIYVATSDGNCKTAVGNWWLGQIKPPKSLSVSQYKIINKIIQGYNQQLPIMLFSSEHKQYDDGDINNIIDIFSMFVFKKRIQIQVSELNFAESLQEIQAYLMCGYITVIYGAEYLKSAQIYELVQISNTIRRRRGDFQGILIPYIDQQIINQNSTKAENHIPISMRNANYNDLKDVGSMVLVIPQLSSVITAGKFLQVPRLQSEVLSHYDYSGTSKMEVSQSFQIESSYDQSQNSTMAIESSDGVGARRIGTNQFSQINSVNTFGQKIIDLFRFKQEVSLEYRAPNLVFTQISNIYGKQFYEVSCFLRQLNYDIPKLQPNDLKYLLTKTNQNNGFAVASLLLDFIMKIQVYIFSLDQNQIKFGQMIANFIASSFGCKPDETAQLVSMAQMNFHYQVNAISRLKIPIPKYVEVVDVQFQHYYNKYISNLLDSNQQTFYNVLQRVYKLNSQTVYDLILVKEFMRYRKPIMLICPQVNYLRTFINIYVGIYQRQGQMEFYYNMEEVEDALIQLQYGNKKVLSNCATDTQQKNQPGKAVQQYIICLFISSLDDLERARKLVIALSCINGVYRTQIGIQIDFATVNVQFILLSDNVIAQQLEHSRTSAILSHKMIIYPGIDKIASAQQIFGIKMRYNNDHLCRYMTMKKGDQFNEAENNTYFQQLIKKYEFVLNNQKDKKLDNFSIHYKTETLQQIVNGLICFCVNTMDGIFSVNNSFDEQMLLSTMFFYNLYKCGVMQIVRRPIIGNHFNETRKLDVFTFLQLNYQKIKQEMQNKINDNLKGTDLNGLFYKLDEDSLISQQVKAQIRQQFYNISETLPYSVELAGFSSAEYTRRNFILRDRQGSSGQGQLNETIERTIQRIFSQDMQQTGVGNYGSYHYEFNNEWLRQHYYENITMLDGIKNIMKIFLAAMWNVYSHYCIVCQNGLVEEHAVCEQLKTKYGQLLTDTKDQARRYTQSSGEHNHVEMLYQTIYQAKQLDEKVIGMNQWDDVLQSCTKMDRDSFVTNKQAVAQAAQSLIGQSLEQLPEKHGDGGLSYLWYDYLENSVSFVRYELGVGLLGNVSELSDQQIIEKQMLEQALLAQKYQAAYQKQLDRYNKQLGAQAQQQQEGYMLGARDEGGAEPGPRPPVFQPPLIRQRNQVSIQRVSHNGSPLVIDNRRAAIISFISQAMLCPFSFVVYGLRNSGKSVLIDIAKLVVREIVVSQQAFIQNPSNSHEIKSAVRSVINQAMLIPMQRFTNYCNMLPERQDTGYNKLEQQILISKHQGFPCLHINVSEVMITGFAVEFPILLRDHVIQCDNEILGQQFNKQFGAIQIQDASFVVEFQTQPLVDMLSLLKVHVPPFTEEYIQKVTQSYWPHESVEWQRQFARGISLIRSSLPPGLINSYSLFQKMYDAYLLTFNPMMQPAGVKASELYNMFRLSKDADLCRGNIHSLFVALRNRSDVNINTMTQVAEKLATLSILKLLENENNNTENPWQDCTIVIKSQTQLIPCWERTILQKSLDFSQQTYENETSTHNEHNAKELISQNKHAMKVINQQFKNIKVVQSVVKDSILKGLQLNDNNLFICLNLQQPRPEALFSVTQSYVQIGQHLDPIITCRLFETFVYLSKIKETTQARLYTVLQYSNNQDALPISGPVGKDSIQQIVKYLLQLTQKNFNPIIEENNRIYKTTYETHEHEEFFENEDLPNRSNFQGLTLSDKLSLKVPKASLIFENVQQIQYQEAVQLMANFQDYRIFNQAMFDTINNTVQRDTQIVDASSDSMSQSSFSNSQSTANQAGGQQNQEKLLFELNSILNSINQQQKQSRNSFKSQQTDIMQVLKQVTMELSSSQENHDFIILFLVCRVAIAYALGIHPIHVLPIVGQANVIRSRYNLALPLNNNMPFEVVSTGRHLINRLPQSISVNHDFNKYLVDTYGTRDEQDLNNVEYNKQNLKTPELNQEELLAKYQFPPMQVCIISPKSLIAMKDSLGISILQYLTFTTEQMCNQEGLFTYEELANISVIVSKEHNLAATIDTMDLVSILATNLQIVIIDDSPLQSQYDYNSNNKIRVIGTCKSPVYEYVKNFQQIYNYAFSEMQKGNQNVVETASLASNLDKRIRGNLQTKQNIISQSEILKQAENNLLIFRPSSFISLYKMAGCTLFTRIDLPERLQLNWVYQEQCFALAVISVFQWCSQNSTRASISLAQFSQYCSRLCNLLLNKYQHFLQRLNTLFSAYRYFEVLSSLGNAQPKIVPLQQFDYVQFRQQIMRVSNYDNNDSEHFANVQHLSVCEMIAIRDVIYTLIEAVKPYYKLIQLQLQTAIYESVACIAYMFYNLNGQISDDYCREKIEEGCFSDLADPAMDSFSSVIVAVMKQAGLQIRLGAANQPSKTDSNRKQLCSCCRSEKGMFLSNVVNIMGQDSPVQFILQMNKVNWKPGDFAQKALLTSFLAHQLGLNTFIVGQEIGLSVAILLAIMQHNGEGGNTIVFHDFYEALLSSQTSAAKSAQQAADRQGSLEHMMGQQQSPNQPKGSATAHQINLTFQHFKDYCTIIDMESDPKAIISQLVKILEGSNQTLIFTNCGSPQTNIVNENFLAKLIHLKNTKSYRKNHQIQIGNQMINLYANLHSYNFVVVLSDNIDYEDYLTRMNLFQQDVYNKIMVIQEDKTHIDHSSTLQDMLIQSIYGKMFSLRNQEQFQIMLSYKTSMQLESMVTAMKKYLQISLSRVSGINQLIREDQIELTISNQINQIQAVNASILQVAKQIVSTNSEKQPTYLVDFLKQAQGIVASLYQKFYSQQEQKNIDKHIVEQMEYLNIVKNNGNKIAEQISQSLNVVLYVLAKLAHVHSPFVIFGTDEFRQKIRDEIHEQLPVMLQKFVAPIILQKTGMPNITQLQTLMYSSKQEQQLLIQQISKIIIPLLLRRLFPLTHTIDALGFYQTFKFLFLCLIGLVSNTSSENQMGLSTKSIAENLKIYMYIVNALQVNRLNHYKMLLFTVLSVQICEIFPADDRVDDINYANVAQMIPKEMSISNGMQLIWLWLISLAKDHSLIRESIKWFRNHSSTLAGLSESPNAFESLISYYMEQASIGNPLCEQIMVQLNQSGCLGEITQMLSPETRNFVQQMPQQLDAPTPSNMMALMVLLSVCQPQNFTKNMILMDVYLKSYTNISIQDLQQYVIDVKQGYAGAITDQPEPSDVIPKIQAAMGFSFACLLEQFGIYRDVNEPVPMEIISESLYSVCNIGQRVFRQVESNLQNMKYDNNIVTSIPLIFIFYDRNIAMFNLLNFCFMIKFGEQDSQLLNSIKLVDKKATVHDLGQSCIVQTLDQCANGTTYCDNLTHIIQKYKLNNKKQQMMPLFLLIPSNSSSVYMQYPSDNGGQAVSKQEIIQFNDALRRLADTGNPHYIYCRSQDNINKAFKHHLSIACGTIHQLTSFKPNILIQRKPGVPINENPNRPSLGGFLSLCYKYSVIMAKENTTSHDNDFVNAVNYLHDINKQFLTEKLANAHTEHSQTQASCNFNTPQTAQALMNIKQDIESSSISVDISVLQQEQHILQNTYQNNFTDPLIHSLQQQFLNPDDKQLDELLFQPRVVSVDNVTVSIESKMKIINEQLRNQPQASRRIRHSLSFKDVNNAGSISLAPSNSIQRMENPGQKILFERMMINTFNLIKGGQLEVSQYGLSDIKKSIIKLLFPSDREIKGDKLYVKAQKQHIQTPRSVTTVSQLIEFCQSLDDYCVSSPSLLNQADINKVPQTVRTMTFQMIVKHSMSSHFITETLSEVIENRHINEDQQESVSQLRNQQEMNSNIKTFITQLANYNKLHFNQFSNYISPQKMVTGLLDDYISNSLQEKGIYNNVGFADFGNYCEINALVYAQVLGDIFYYMMVEQSIQLQVPLSAVRIVILTHAPEGQPVILMDGQVDTSEKKGQERPPYYMKLMNFELIGANYDFELETIIDQSQENINGYKTYMELYAAVAILSIENDEYMKYMRKKLQISGGQNSNKMRVPKGFVPVGLQIGGYVKPYVLLPNRTQISDKIWIQRAPYLGVKFL